MKVLVFVPHNPVPCRSGAHYRMLEMLVGLRELGHQVALAACEDTAENPWTEESTQWLMQNGLSHSVAVFHDAPPSLIPAIVARVWRRVNRSVRSRFVPAHAQPQFSDLTGAALRRWFRRLQAAQAPDCVLINYAWFSKLAPPSRAQQGPRTLVDAHDLVSLNADWQFVYAWRCIEMGMFGAGQYDLIRIAKEMGDAAQLEILKDRNVGRRVRVRPFMHVGTVRSSLPELIDE